MQNVTQFNPNKNKQVISSQVLAEYFSNHDETLELEKTSQGFLLSIPQSFFIKQKSEQQAIDEWINKTSGMIQVEGSKLDLDLFDFDVADHISLFDEE